MTYKLLRRGLVLHKLSGILVKLARSTRRISMETLPSKLGSSCKFFASDRTLKYDFVTWLQEVELPREKLKHGYIQSITYSFRSPDKFWKARWWSSCNGFARISNDVKLVGKSSSRIRWILLLETELRGGGKSELFGYDLNLNELCREYVFLQFVQRANVFQLFRNRGQKVVIQVPAEVNWSIKSDDGVG